ncbi:MAG: DUF3365 domain-containing protein [Cyclobacteriaceae bacterium]
MIRTPFHFILSFFVFSFIQACDPGKPIDREAVQQAIDSREIKKVPKVDIMNKGMELGNAITSEVQMALQKNLMEAIQNEGIPFALEFCNANATNIAQEIADSMGVNVIRVSEKFRNPNGKPDSLENLILASYQYNIEEQLSIEPALVEENPKTLLYTQPIMISSGLCLQCHGTIGKELSEENHQTISALYPSDSAIGYKIGDLRGMWAVRIPIKSVIGKL